MKKKNILNRYLSFIFSCSLALYLLPSLLLSPFSSFAAVDSSLCASVKIEIRQEMTLERQAFDAHMRINNGLTHITLENVEVEVNFSDEEGNSVLATSDPGNTGALFFIRLDSMENIDNVAGSGTVLPSSYADIHWLIIPAPGASRGLSQGTLYYVGATLSYTIGGEQHVTRITPDYIFVKPMPQLTLDYFLPIDVYGDDAFTQEIEPSIPFPLGVRVKNNGFGAARNLKIDSAQPKIVENEMGLLIGFVIEGCQVNGGEAMKSLLADFGDIEPDTSGVARWIMTCSLSGRFLEFKAEYSHSNELGGEVTSLLEAANTHFIIHDVLVDLAGRDTICDFLAKDGGVYRVYESDSVDTGVTDQSSFSTIQLTGPDYLLSTPVTAGFMYVQLPDPSAGQKVLKEVIRSDGKRIKAENAWLSKTRNQDHTWQHLINLFDVNTSGSYTLIFEDAGAEPHPPVLQFIPDRTRVEGNQLSFIVEASDPDGTIPSLTATPLPALATFTDQGQGVGIFDWTPAIGQAGRYEITFTASDGILKNSRRAVMTIDPVGNCGVEICDGVDNNCNGQVDEEEAQGCTIYYEDADGDTYGVNGDSRCLCSSDSANKYTATRGGDCHDANPNISPGAIEVCDGLDNNCDGVVDRISPFLPQGAMLYNMVIYGTAYICQEPASYGLIGAFGSGGEEDCRGVGVVQADGSYYVTITANQPGEPIYFRLQRCLDGQVLDSMESITFTPDVTLENKALSFGICTQSINLMKGWNWVSFNVLPDDTSLGAFFGEFAGLVKQVKTQTRSVTNVLGLGWIGDDPNIMARIGQVDATNGTMFKIRAEEGFTLNVTGRCLAPDLPIQLNAGWTWIAYLPDCCLSFEEVFPPEADLFPPLVDDLFQIKGQTQSRTKTPRGLIIGDLNEMCPGKGYAIKMNVERTLTYPDFRTYPDHQCTGASRIVDQCY